MKKENKHWKHDTLEKPIRKQRANTKRNKSNTGKAKPKTNKLTLTFFRNLQMTKK
jgi:hypothetical protein